ncbi:RagB/SusD family nutrient uptake outer membrane protein [Fulvivirga sp. M361]|uniref:RagB/SusD family nutrient uptake outer membrane protein n=1 Tax=Fulvivirga sp. M361 TaxID=2594266 RepID=UPI00117B7698|nr:RagB/SusD family nutrient uptake outer membrane protein [Fulvivirga sp. M361]TRX59155.1 RagB/SusD family nutrient uptake outer membrane protein [Fulvivirga sp. M361]
MKRLPKQLTIILLITLCLAGCEEFLEDEIQTLKTEEVIDFREQSRGLINDIYSDYAFNYFSDFSIEYLTDNAVNRSSPQHLATGFWGPTDNPFGNLWKRSYNNIRQVVQYIEEVHNTGLPFKPAAQDSLENVRTLRRYFGEAHFLKAFAEWELLRIYSGPSAATGDMLGFPIINSILASGDYTTLSRASFEQCVDRVMMDLDTAIQYLPLIYSGKGNSNPGYSVIETGRASGLAAHALKAKVALLAASPAFNPTNDVSKWERAAQLAHELIIQNGGLKTLQPYDFRREDNPDHIWRLRLFRQNNSLERRLYPPTLFGQGEVNPSQNLVDAFPAVNGYPISAVESGFDPDNPYANRDPRFNRFIFFNGDHCFDNSSGCQNYDTLEIFEGGRDYFGGFIPNVGTRTGYYLKRFLNDLDFDPSVNDAVTNLPKVYVQLGLTEMYLTYAEAANEAYGQPNTIPPGMTFSAREALAFVRQRAGISPDPYLDAVALSTDDFRELVRNERRIELSFSGERFHDLRRWRIIDTMDNVRGMKILRNDNNTFSHEEISVEDRVFDAKNYYLPLPYEELLLNTNLEQNQGW